MRPLVVCASSVVVALVTDGVSATGLTVIVAVTTAPLSPASMPPMPDWMLTCPVVLLLASGVNFRPAEPARNDTHVPLVISLVPSLRKSRPPVIEVTLNESTSAPSFGFRLTTSPVDDCASSLVTASVIDGVSARGVTVNRNVALPLPEPDAVTVM